MPDTVATHSVTVVIVHWNQPVRCATTIERFQHQGVPVRILVVDNGSTPDELDALRRTVATSPFEVSLLEQGQNLGFGPGANVGLRHWFRNGPAEGSSDWVAVAPHDALPAEGTLARLIEAAEARPHAGLVCADVGDGHIPVYDPYFGGMTVPASPEALAAGVLAPAGVWESVDYPHGTLLLARRPCLDEVGLFDERYFAYCEEADLGLRARRQGWEVGLVRGAHVVNPTMRSGSPAVDYLMQRNTLLLVREHSGRYHAFIRFCIGCWQLARGLVRPSPHTFVFSGRARARAMVDFLRGRYGPPPASMFAEAGEPPP